MAAMEDRLNFVPKQKLMVPTVDMVPVPPEIQELLQAYGVDRHMIAYFNREEPSRVYVNANGQLHFIDLSAPNLANGTILRNSALKACELARIVPVVESDLESELNKKSNKNEISSTIGSSNCTDTSTWQTLTDSEREELQRVRRKRNAYKTALCKSFRENGVCPFGEECVFAHGENELRLPPQAHPKYKTKLCNKFSVLNYCPYGARCQYIHERITAPNFWNNENSGETLQHPSSHFNVRRMNPSVVCANSPITLGNHSSFDESCCFSSSLTSYEFDCSEKQRKSQKGPGSFGPNFSGYDDNKSHLNAETVTNDTILNHLYEHFNNMLVHPVASEVPHIS